MRSSSGGGFGRGLTNDLPSLTATESHVAVTRAPRAVPAHSGNHRNHSRGQWLRLIAAENGIVLLCQRCGRPFQTDVIRALCGACQRAQGGG